LATLALVLGALARPALANCGAEGCPFTPAGPEASLGRFALDLGYQRVEQNRIWDGTHEISPAEALAAEGGAGHVLEQLTRTSTFLVTGRATLNRRLTVSAAVPYIDRIHRHTLEHHAGFFIPSEWHMTGVGDATLIGQLRVLAPRSP